MASVDDDAPNSVGAEEEEVAIDPKQALEAKFKTRPQREALQAKGKLKVGS